MLLVKSPCKKVETLCPLSSITDQWFCKCMDQHKRFLGISKGGSFSLQRVIDWGGGEMLYFCLFFCVSLGLNVSFANSFGVGGFQTAHNAGRHMEVRREVSRFLTQVNMKLQKVENKPDSALFLMPKSQLEKMISGLESFGIELSTDLGAQATLAGERLPGFAPMSVAGRMDRGGADVGDFGALHGGAFQRGTPEAARADAMKDLGAESILMRIHAVVARLNAFVSKGNIYVLAVDPNRLRALVDRYLSSEGIEKHLSGSFGNKKLGKQKYDRSADKQVFAAYFKANRKSLNKLAKKDQAADSAWSKVLTAYHCLLMEHGAEMLLTLRAIKATGWKKQNFIKEMTSASVSSQIQSTKSHLVGLLGDLKKPEFKQLTAESGDASVLLAECREILKDAELNFLAQAEELLKDPVIASTKQGTLFVKRFHDLEKMASKKQKITLYSKLQTVADDDGLDVPAQSRAQAKAILEAKEHNNQKGLKGQNEDLRYLREKQEERKSAGQQTRLARRQAPAPVAAA